MEEARFLVRLSNRPPAAPSEQPLILARLRRLAAPLGGAVANLRVTPRAFEFDLFCAPQASLDDFLAAWQGVGTPLGVRRLDVAPAARRSAADMLAQARALFNEARYWEVHEVLEDLWRARAGDEKRLLQGLILLAAALVHLQRNESDVAWPMMCQGAERLDKQPSPYYEWDLERLRKSFLRMAASRREEEITV